MNASMAAAPLPAETLSILALEDSAIDAELITEHLLAAGLDVQVKRVWTRPEFVAALEQGSHDLILADHVLPQFDGDTALTLAREMAPDTPFVFVSGTLTEELAVQALKRGATDYVVKQRLQRLPDVVQRAVSEARERASRRAAEAALRETEQRLNAVLDNASVAVFFMDEQHQCIYMNAAAEKLTGYTLADMRGRRLHDVIHHSYPDGRHFPSHECPIDSAFPGQALVEGETMFVHKDGHFYPVSYTASPMRDSGSKAIGTIVEARDISAEKRQMQERERAEEALRQLNETLEQRVADRTSELEFLYNNTPVPLHSQTPEGIVISVSDRWLEFMGFDSRDEVIGRPAADFLTEESARRHWNEYWPALLANGEADDVEYQVVKRSGEVADMLISSRLAYDGDGKLVRTMAASVDITGRRQTEEALRQSQKMDAIGQLTGGVAHDFNNFLTIIRSSADLLRRHEISDEKKRRYIDAISDTADRAAKLTGQLLAFARRQPLNPEIFDAAEQVREIGDMMRTVIGSRIDLLLDLDQESCLIEADPAQFETALINIAVNARDAMSGEGKLIITTRRSAVLPGVRGQLPAKGEYVAISVTDTGAGMPPDMLPQIFEPFFTTKAVGKGTGLGLSQVYGFVKQSRGDIDVQSELGRGTSFTLYLPRVEERRQAALDDSARTVGSPPKPLRILMVEDNAEVREFAAQLLRELGHSADCAGSGQEALGLLDKAPDGYDLVLTDVIMPGMSGIELGRTIRERDLKLPVILTSGYSHVLAAEGSHGFELLNKPYSVETLSRALRSARVAKR
jgi:PAS domain S-box-containing protein